MVQSRISCVTFIPIFTEETRFVVGYTFIAVFTDHAVAVVVDLITAIFIVFFVIADDIVSRSGASAAIGFIAVSGWFGVNEFAIDAGENANFCGRANAFVVVGDVAGAPAGLNELFAEGFVFGAVSAFGAGAIDAAVAVVVFAIAIFSGEGMNGRVCVIGILRIGLAERAFVDVFFGFGFHVTVFVVVVAVIDLIFADAAAFGCRIHDAAASIQAVVIFLADESIFCLDISVFDGAAEADGQKSRANKRCQ